MEARVTRCILALMFVVWLSACHSWVPLGPLDDGLEAQSAMKFDAREELRLYRRDGRVVEGKVIELTTDTVSVGSSPERFVLVPLADIMGAEVRRPDPRKTVVTVVGVVATAAAAVIVIVMDEDTGPED
jgi:hypothetical protein